jgi:hypothetical protein
VAVYDVEWPGSDSAGPFRRIDLAV